MAGQIAVEIRWDGSNWVDETDHVMSGNCSRGRAYASQVVAVAGAGTANLVLRNDDGRYSYWEPSSPRYLTHLRDVAIRIRLVQPTPARTLWTGTIHDPANNSQVHAAPVWPIQCWGVFNRLVQPRTCEPVGSGGDTADILMGAVLDAAGWPDDERVMDTGVVTTGVWQPGSVEPLSELRKLEATDLGFVYEGRDGQFHFEARDYRPTTTRCTTSQLTLSDDPNADYHYRLLNLTAPEQYVYDRIKVDFQPVFTLEDEPAAMVEFVGSIFGLRVPAGKSRRFTLNAFHFYGDLAAGYRVVEWVLPTIQAGPTTSTVEINEGIGGASASDVTISAISTTDTEISFTLSNSSDLEAVVQYVLLYGIRGLAGQTISQIVGSGTREYPLPGSYYPDGASASKAARWLLNYFGQPRHLATVEVLVSRSEDLLTDVFACDLSTRITLEGIGRFTKLGMTEDFYVESERISFENHGRNLGVQWQCSACLPNTQDLEDPESSLPTGLGIYYPMEQSSGDVIDLVDGYDLTRHGTTTAVGRVGRGQQLVAIQGDALLQPTSGLPDDHLNDENEWNGWLQIGAATFDDQIILRKGLGAQAGYVLYTTLLSTHQYIQAAVWNGASLFTTTLNGHILVPGDWHFFRLVHDAANLRIGVSTDLGPFDWVTYTGSIVSSTDGIIFGGAGSFGTGTTFEYWYKAPDVTGADGDAVTTWPDRSGNGRDADTPSGSVTVQDGELAGQRIVRFGPGVLRIPEMALGPVQIFLVLKITSQSFQGTIFRTSATPGPNYAVGLNENFGTYELFVHYYTDHNNSPVKRHVVVSAPPLGYAVYCLTDDGTGGAIELAINGVVQTLVPNGANLTGASGIDPDGTDELDVFEIIVATGLSPTEVGIVEDALLYEAGLGGSPPAGGKSLNGILDEWGFWPTRFLTDVEAESLYNHGAGTTSTGGTVNTTSPSSAPVVPGNVPSGTLADRPTTAPTNSLYFATDEQGGTLYLMIGSTWTQVASGLTADIPNALVDAKGDLVTATSDDTPARLPVGTNGQLLAANSAEANGLEWIDPPVIPTVGQYRQLLYSSPDGIHFDLIDDGAGHPVTVLADLE
jgi:hypothetical protein